MTDVSFRVVPFDGLTTDELYRLLALRVEVFVVEQRCAYQDLDGLDPIALHLLAELPDGEIVACARLLPAGTSWPDDPAIGRVVTSPRVRGTGVGARLMEEAIARTREAFHGSTRIQLGAQNVVIPFYRKLGFREVGESYLEDGIPHTRMVLDLRG